MVISLNCIDDGALESNLTVTYASIAIGVKNSTAVFLLFFV